MTKGNDNKTNIISLLENPNMETQAKVSFWRDLVKVLIISFLFVVLIFGYIIQFSSNSFSNVFGLKFTGTFSANNFCNAHNGDLIIIDEYESFNEIQIGDVVCFFNSLGKGSGEVVGKQSNIVEVELANEDIIRLSSKNIVGKQSKTIPFLGYLVEFIGGYFGIIVFNLILLAYVAYLTFSRINYENTSHGKMLYAKFKQNQKEAKRNKKLLKKLEGLDDIKYVIVSILEGNFEENKNKFLNFEPEFKMNLKEKYKYILRSVHEAYLTNEKLSKEEKKQISSLVELMCLCNDIDNDIEYMVVDLLLKTKMIDFDTKNFAEMVVGFLKSKLDDDDLMNLGSVLYVLIYKNKKIVDENIRELCKAYLEKAQELTGNERKMVEGVAYTIINLIK